MFVLGYALDTLNLLGDSGLNFYLRLLGLSGFTGTICWVAICWSQIVFRKRLKERGYAIDTALTVKARWYPWLQYFSIIVMIAALIAMCVEDWLVFTVGVLCTFVPMIGYAAARSMEMALLTAKRSTCMRRNVGAVIVQEKHIIATGYNGAPKGIPHCEEIGGCLREKQNIPSGERHVATIQCRGAIHWNSRQIFAAE